MTQLRELEMRLLSELNEAGQETLTAMLNTIVDPTGDPAELFEYQQAIETLVRRNLLRLSLSKDHAGHFVGASEEKSIESIQMALSHFLYDPRRTIWTDKRRTGPPFATLFPILVDTAEGRAEAQRILQQRGYQWWKKQK